MRYTEITNPTKPRETTNNAGGTVFKISDWEVLNRFLILGTEGGTYYSTEKKLTLDNAKTVQKLLNEDPIRVIHTVIEISEAGRAIKNDPAIFVLAMAASHSNQNVRTAALDALPRVCRTGTHLLQFVSEVTQMRGWGRALRRAVGNWYNLKSVEDAAYQMMKYGSRFGWTHRDVLRVSHPFPLSEERKGLYAWATSGDTSNIPNKLQAAHQVKELWLKDGQAALIGICNLITEHNLPREVVPTELLSYKEVWAALSQKMPITATIRNLATMTRCGYLSPMSSESKAICEKITNSEILKKGKVHPFSLLLALDAYQNGQSKGGKIHSPVQEILGALEDSFYIAFGNVSPANKRTYIGLDVSGSMFFSFLNKTNLSAAQAATAMSLVTLNTEPFTAIYGFSTKLVPLNFTIGTRLNDALSKTRGVPFGGTDCAQPMIHAKENKIPVDTFVVYTDNETWAGNISPVHALEQYKQAMGIDSKLVVVGMTATNFSIADPLNPNMLDVVGFDSSGPQVISEFSKQS